MQIDRSGEVVHCGFRLALDLVDSAVVERYIMADGFVVVRRRCWLTRREVCSRVAAFLGPRLAFRRCKQTADCSGQDNDGFASLSLKTRRESSASI